MDAYEAIEELRAALGPQTSTNQLADVQEELEALLEWIDEEWVRRDGSWSRESVIAARKAAASEKQTHS